MQLWMKSYPRLSRDPAMREILEEAVLMKMRIEDLEDKMNRMPDKPYLHALNLLNKLLYRWAHLLDKMGLTTRAKPYMQKETKGVLPPDELWKMKQVKQEEEE